MAVPARGQRHFCANQKKKKKVKKVKEYLRDKKYGFFVTVALMVLSVVTMIIYASIYGNTRFMSWAGFGIILGGVVLAAILIVLKQYRFVPALLLAANFLGFLLYVYYIYFHVSVVLVGIQSSGFPPEFFLNVVFFVLTLVVSVANVYFPQVEENA